MRTLGFLRNATSFPFIQPDPIMNFALPLINLAQALMLRGGTGVVAFLSSSLRNPRPRGRDGRGRPHLPLHRGDGVEEAVHGQGRHIGIG